MARDSKHRTAAQHLPTAPGSDCTAPDPFFDDLALAAGPGRAVVVDEYGLLGVVDYDHERGAALDAVPPAGFVS